MTPEATRPDTSRDVAAVISRLIARGGHFAAEGDRLRYSGPDGLLTDELDAFIGLHKAEALAVIVEWQSSLDGPAWPLVREGDYTMDGDSCGCIN